MAWVILALGAQGLISSIKLSLSRRWLFVACSAYKRVMKAAVSNERYK